MNYQDFEIEVRPQGGREYELALIRSPAGEGREQATLPFSELQLKNHLLNVEVAMLRSGNVRRMALSEEEEAVQSFGRELFDFLLPNELRGLYRTSLNRAHTAGNGLRLKLRLNDPKLAFLPWEFLYDGNRREYVCLSIETPLVRYIEAQRPIPPLHVKPPLRILGMVVNPKNYPQHLDVVKEKQRVEEAVQDLQSEGLVELHWLQGGTYRDLQRELRRGPWHIFHFIGHGSFDTARDEGQLIFADRNGNAKPFGAVSLARLLADHKPLRLALLNACEGARGGAELFSGTAPILVTRGLPAVVAMQYAITDTGAIEFARTFYESLADGYPMDAAVGEARKGMSFAFAQTVEWGVPVLYMRSKDGHLFDLADVPDHPSVGAQRVAPLPRQPEVVEREDDRPSTPKRQQPKIAVVEPPKPQRWEPKPYDGIEWIEIPAGEFWMGAAEHDTQAQDREKPLHKLHLPTYWIAKTPVTNAQYLTFMQGSGYDKTPRHWKNGRYPTNKADHPVVYVSWHDAIAYCDWVSKVAGYEVTLPSEAEWEKAARGGVQLASTNEQLANPMPLRIYPWGDEFREGCCNDVDVGIYGTSPVSQFREGASPYGVWDMSGNVWEWTRSIYEGYVYKPDDGRENLESLKERVLRGGSYLNSHAYARVAYRYGYNPSYHAGDYGFRVCHCFPSH